jgi:hypothetical protein
MSSYLQQICVDVLDYSARRPPADLRGCFGLLSQANWVTCQECEQAAAGTYFGRVLAIGKRVTEHRNAIEPRIANVARLASARQPERKIVSQEWDGDVLTTSQKLAHRLATELAKAFGGKPTYRWNDNDGSLLATWRCPTIARREKMKPSA